MNDKLRIDQIIQAWGFSDRKTLDVWLYNGMPMFEGEIDDNDLIRDDQSGKYRIKTDEDRRIQKERQAKWREENPLMSKLMDRYVKEITDSIFDARPLLFKMRDFDE